MGSIRKSSEKDLKEMIPFTDTMSYTPTMKPVFWLCTCRWTLAIIGFFVFVNNYSMRVNMSVAMVCMVNHTAVQLDAAARGGTNKSKVSAAVNDEQCLLGDVGLNSTVKPTNEGEFNWNKESQSLVLSSFFWGYLLTQILAGWLAQKFGGKRVMGYFMLVAVISSLLSSVGARVSPYLLMALRILNGMGQGAMFPTMHALWSKWAPPLERSKLIGFTYAGAQIGNVVTLPLAAVLCDYGFDGGWSSIFYVFGISGAVCFTLWMILVSDSPAQHPRITAQERHYIESSLGNKRANSANVTPWLEFAKSVPFWAIIVAQFCVLWGTFTLLTNIPTYMKEILKFNITSNGALSAIPYILFWLCINIGGVIADHMRSKGFATKNVRKLMLTVGSVIPGIMLIATGYVSCRTPYVAVACLSMALGFSGFHFPGVMVNHADIAPPFAAVMFGIANTIATLSGVFAPYVVGLLTPNGTQAEWQIVFYISAVIYFVGAVVFCLFADGEIQPWVRPYMEETSAELTALQPIFTDVTGTEARRNGSNGAAHDA